MPIAGGCSGAISIIVSVPNFPFRNIASGFRQSIGLLPAARHIHLLVSAVGTHAAGNSARPIPLVRAGRPRANSAPDTATAANSEPSARNGSARPPGQDMVAAARRCGSARLACRGRVRTDCVGGWSRAADRSCSARRCGRDGGRVSARRSWCAPGRRALRAVRPTRPQCSVCSIGVSSTVDTSAEISGVGIGHVFPSLAATDILTRQNAFRARDFGRSWSCR
jgi:hypothetical protein